jgi:hypothetical protein
MKSQISNLKFAVLALVLCSLIANLGCKNSDVETALGIAGSHASQLARNAATVYGAEDPRARRVQDGADKLGRLKAAFANATTPDEQLALLPALNASIDFFDSDILPLLKLSPTSQLIALAVEDALRLAAGHFVKSADQVTAKAPRAMHRAGAAAGDEAPDQVAKLKAYLKTQLRARDAVTGRFVSAEYARAHPDTTVVERVEKR